MKGYNFYKKNCQSIEIVKDDELQKANFRVKTTRVLREEVKEMLKWSVDRSSPSNKIRDLMAWSVDIMKDIAYQRKILNNPVAVLLTKGWLLWNNTVTILSFAINILMLLTWNAKASLNDPGLFKNSTAIPPAVNDPIPDISNLSSEQYVLVIYALGGLHNFFCLLVVISYFVGNHPRLPDPKAFFLDIKAYFEARKKDDDEGEEDKKKEHVCKMDAKLLGFTTLYYLSFLALSIGGTLFHGYFFAYHLLNIVNGNQLLSGVIKAVTQNGRSLVWVGILGLCVFYLYAIISFAMMRSMFDPNDYLYCDTLWQCTVTIIRYGLIGDLFDTIKAHKTEKNFRKFGFVVLYHVSFFIFITTIGLNIIFGIIVDTFSELRDLKWTAESDMRDTCFICSRNSYDFEHYGNGFEQHVRHEHNMWSYIFFFIHLDNTKLNDYTALEMYVYKLLQKENYEFFPLDRALSLSAMGQDSTEVKIDDLLYHVTSIVQKQKREELEKKRQEEKMRQTAWEEKHRLVPFPNTLQGALHEEEFPGDTQEEQFDTLNVNSPTRGLSPSFSRRQSIVAAARRPSNAGSGYQTPLGRHDKYRRRRSISPMEQREIMYKLAGPTRGFDDDQVSISGTTVYGWDERIHSPTLFGLDDEVMDILPVSYSRRQSVDYYRTARLSIAPGSREPYISETDPTPYLRHLAQQYSQERRQSQTYPEGRSLVLPPDKDTDKGDVESIASDGPPDTQF